MRRLFRLLGMCMQDKKYCVYRHTFPNGKVYIGYTGQKPTDRWCSGTGYKHQQLVYRAILRYGWDNIQHDIIADGLTHEQAVAMEIELIKAYDSMNPDHGYNTTPGGDGRLDCRGENHPMYGKHHTEESRRKMSESLRGRVSPTKGKHLSEETKEKLRKANLGKKYQRSPEWYKKVSESNLGKKRSEETKRRLAVAKSKPVAQFTVNGEFVRNWPSAVEAHRHTGIDKSHISLACRNERRTAGGYKWEFIIEYKEENLCP